MTHWKLRKELFFHDSKSWFFLDMSQSIQVFFWIRRKELHPFFEYDAKNWTLFSLNTTQRIEPFFLWIRRKELNPLSLNTTQRIESFFLWTWRKELKALFKMTRRIEPSRKNCSKTWTFFFLNLTQRIEPFFWMRLKNWNFLAEK